MSLDRRHAVRRQQISPRIRVGPGAALQHQAQQQALLTWKAAYGGASVREVVANDSPIFGLNLNRREDDRAGKVESGGDSTASYPGHAFSECWPPPSCLRHV